MKTIDFTQNGGYRLKQSTLGRMQDAYFELLNSYISSLGLPNTGNFIISGCEISGSNITSGFMYIDGELCPFTQTEGSITSKIKKETDYQSISFKNGSNLPVWKTTTAVIDDEGVELNNFQRVYLVQDPNYVHTDNNFTNFLLNKLNGIQENAQVNIKPDWNAPTSAPNGILNRPNGILNIYTSGAQVLGDIFGNQIFTVIIQNVPTSNYDVLVSFFDSAFDGGTYTYCITEKNQNFFKIRVRELDNWVQNVRLEYYIIAKN